MATIDAQVRRDREQHEIDMVSDMAKNALEARRRAAEEALHPRLVEAGPMEWITGGALERWPSMCFDVNGYYATLGVNWRATKRQIRHQYQTIRGDRYPRHTYIVKQLLNDQIRRAYDACQPGSVFFDQYMADYVKAQMLEDSRRENGRSLTLDEQAALGLEAVDLSDLMNKAKVVDKEGLVDQDEGWLDEDLSPDLRWRWGYYLWRTEHYDTKLLREWQESLLRAAHERRLHLRLTLGLMGDSAESFTVERIGYRTVVFLHDAETANLDDLAIQAIDRVVNAEHYRQ